MAADSMGSLLQQAPQLSEAPTRYEYARAGWRAVMERSSSGAGVTMEKGARLPVAEAVYDGHPGSGG